MSFGGFCLIINEKYENFLHAQSLLDQRLKEIAESERADIKLVPIYSPARQDIEIMVCEQMDMPTLPNCGLGWLIAEFVGPLSRIRWKIVEKKVKKKCLIDKATRRAQIYQRHHMSNI